MFNNPLWHHPEACKVPRRWNCPAPFKPVATALRLWSEYLCTVPACSILCTWKIFFLLRKYLRTGGLSGLRVFASSRKSALARPDGSMPGERVYAPCRAKGAMGWEGQPFPPKYPHVAWGFRLTSVIVVWTTRCSMTWYLMKDMVSCLQDPQYTRHLSIWNLVEVGVSEKIRYCCDNCAKGIQRIES